MADFSSPMRDKIVALYGEGILHKSVVRIRGGAGVITELLSPGKFKTVLEIGTFKGVGAAEISQYVDKVITIDLHQGRVEQLGEPFDRQAFWKSLGITNIEFHAVKDDAEKTALVNSLDFDFAFVDGAHDPTVRNDFELVKRCGHVLFHDVDSRGRPELDYVYDFVMSLPKEQMRFLDIFGYWRG